MKEGTVVATHGDINSRSQSRHELRQGLLPIEDHVRGRPAHAPLLRMKDGKYAKNGEFASV